MSVSNAAHEGGVPFWDRNRRHLAVGDAGGLARTSVQVLSTWTSPSRSATVTVSAECPLRLRREETFSAK
jgi:hypothetical protein